MHGTMNVKKKTKKNTGVLNFKVMCVHMLRTWRVYVMNYLCQLGMYGSMLPVDVFPIPGSGFPLLSATVLFCPHTSCHFPNLVRCRTEDGGYIFLQSDQMYTFNNSWYNTNV